MMRAQIVKQHKQRIYAFALAPSGTKYAVALKDKSIDICDMRGNCLKRWSDASIIYWRQPVLAWSRDGNYLLRTCAGSGIRIIKEGRTVYEDDHDLDEDDIHYVCAAWSSDNELAVSCGYRIRIIANVATPAGRFWMEVATIASGDDRPVNILYWDATRIVAAKAFSQQTVAWNRDDDYALDPMYVNKNAKDARHQFQRQINDRHILYSESSPDKRLQLLSSNYADPNPIRIYNNESDERMHSFQGCFGAAWTADSRRVVCVAHGDSGAATSVASFVVGKWRTQNHPLFSPRFKQLVRLLLLVDRRLVLSLPPEVWLIVFEFLADC
jgi:WD40 repeat protein